MALGLFCLRLPAARVTFQAANAIFDAELHRDVDRRRQRARLPAASLRGPLLSTCISPGPRPQFQALMDRLATDQAALGSPISALTSQSGAAAHVRRLHADDRRRHFRHALGPVTGLRRLVRLAALPRHQPQGGLGRWPPTPPPDLDRLDPPGLALCDRRHRLDRASPGGGIYGGARGGSPFPLAGRPSAQSNAGAGDRLTPARHAHHGLIPPRRRFPVDVAVSWSQP